MADAYGPCRLLYISMKLLGPTIFILMVVWMNIEGEGMSWSDPKRVFRFHPMFMSLSLLVLNGEAVTIYRGLRNVPKKFTKLVHFGIHALNVVFLVVGLKAAFNSNNYHQNANGKDDPLPNLQTGHSWLGLILVIFYCLQFASGTVVYLLPFMPQEKRAESMPMHRAFGAVLFSLSFLTAFIGVGERAAWSIKCEPPRSLCGEKVLVNILLLALTVYFIFAMVILIRPDWIRQVLDSESPKSDHEKSETARELILEKPLSSEPLSNAD